MIDFRRQRLIDRSHDNGIRATDRPPPTRAQCSVTMQYQTWRFFTVLLTRLPLRASYAVATAVGVAWFEAWRPMQRNMCRNFRRVLPSASRDYVRRTARASLVNYCHYLVDFMRFPARSKEEVRALVADETVFRQLDAVRAGGRGVVVVALHFGVWDAGAAALAARGYPVNVLVQTFEDRRLDAMVVGSRERLGMRIHRIEKAGPELVRLLKRGEILVVLLDRAAVMQGVDVTFFGGRLTVPTGPARLAMRTGAALVAASGPRIRRGAPEIEIVAEFGIAADGEESTVASISQRLMSAHERMIRAHPDQWYMFQDMWPAEALEGR